MAVVVVAAVVVIVVIVIIVVIALAVVVAVVCVVDRGAVSVIASEHTFNALLLLLGRSHGRFIAMLAYSCPRRRRCCCCC